jgi:hypothetical protein
MDLTEYDGVEMHPVAREIRDGMELFEQCDRDSPDLHCWSVYLHMKEGFTLISQLKPYRHRHRVKPFLMCHATPWLMLCALLS